MLPNAGQFAGTRPLEEADARTIFVSNVRSHSFFACLKKLATIYQPSYVDFLHTGSLCCNEG